jgi:hypothetical protein
MGKKERMSAKPEPCEFMLVRYAPDPVKGEFVNIGVVLLESGAGRGFTGVRFTRDWRRVRCLDPEADLEVLDRLEADLRGELAGAAREQVLHLMQQSFSGALQVTAATAVLAADPAGELDRLAELYLATSRAESRRDASGRQVVLGQMRAAFEQAGVWKAMKKRIAAADYTRPGDPLRIDCGYQPNGTVRMFHALSLTTDVDAAKVLAFTFPRLAAGMQKQERVGAELTAIVEDQLDRSDDEVAFALETLAASSILVAPARELPGLAERARSELKL